MGVSLVSLHYAFLLQMKLVTFQAIWGINDADNDPLLFIFFAFSLYYVLCFLCACFRKIWRWGALAMNVHKENSSLNSSFFGFFSLTHWYRAVTQYPCPCICPLWQSRKVFSSKITCFSSPSCWFRESPRMNAKVLIVLCIVMVAVTMMMGQAEAVRCRYKCKLKCNPRCGVHCGIHCGRRDEPEQMVSRIYKISIYQMWTD